MGRSSTAPSRSAVISRNCCVVISPLALSLSSCATARPGASCVPRADMFVPNQYHAAGGIIKADDGKRGYLLIAPAQPPNMFNPSTCRVSVADDV
eukprot:5302438-Prymnesium_polylepis.1